MASLSGGDDNLYVEARSRTKASTYQSWVPWLNIVKMLREKPCYPIDHLGVKMSMRERKKSSVLKKTKEKR
jgi:hypothetical protein